MYIRTIFSIEKDDEVDPASCGAMTLARTPDNFYRY